MAPYERQVSLFVAGFLSTANILDGHVVGAGIDRAFELDGVHLPSPPGAKLVFRS